VARGWAFTQAVSSPARLRIPRGVRPRRRETCRWVKCAGVSRRRSSAQGDGRRCRAGPAAHVEMDRVRQAEIDRRLAEAEHDGRAPPPRAAPRPAPALDASGIWRPHAKAARRLEDPGDEIAQADLIRSRRTEQDSRCCRAERTAPCRRFGICCRSSWAARAAIGRPRVHEGGVPPSRRIVVRLAQRRQQTAAILRTEEPRRADGRTDDVGMQVIPPA